MENPIVHYLLRTFNKLSYQYRFFADLKNFLRSCKYVVFGKSDFSLVIDKFKKSNINFKKPLIVFDIGAAVGDKSIIILESLPTATVYSFEPQQESFRKLKVRTAQYGDRLKAFNVGFFDKNEEVTLHISSYRDSSSILPLDSESEDEDMREINKEIIKVITLDDFVRDNHIERIDFMKIDVEGVEKKVLEGGKTTFANKVDNVFLEIFDPNDFPYFLEFFKKFGFKFVGRYQDYFFSKIGIS